MKLGEKNINGFWIYSPDAIYDKGDFVIYQDQIYICQVNGTPSGVSPDTLERGYWKSYLGDKMASLKDYEELAKEGSGKDKYISLEFLQGILGKFIYGLDGNGVIREELIQGGSKEDPLDSLLSNKDLPNTVITKVSREIGSIKNFIRESTKDPWVILKQYTYSLEDSLKRIQILFDTTYGMIYYRGASLDSETYINDSWKCIHTSTLQNFIDKHNELLITYSSRLDYLKELTDSLKYNFRYSKISIGSPSKEITLTTDPSKGPNYFLETFDTQISLGILTETSEELKNFWGTTINPSWEIQDYGISGSSIKVHIEYLSENTIKISISEGVIQSLSYQQYYG